MPHQELLRRFGLTGDQPSADGLDVTTPIDGTRIATLAPHTPADVEAMVMRAAAAFKAWRAVPAPRRGELVRLLGEELRAAKADLGALVTLECGKILQEGLGEVKEMIDICDFAAELDAKTTSNLPWWEQFRDPVLNRLVERGIKNNLDLKTAIANVERFMGLYGSTRADLFPQIFGAGAYLREQPSSLGQDIDRSERDNASLGASMQWEIDIWGKLRRAKEAAQADLLSQEAVKRGVILSLASAIAQTYVQLRTYDKDLEITREIVETLRKDLRIRRVRFEEGYTSELEVTQAESEYDRRSAFIPFCEQSIAQTEHALNVLLGENPGPIERGLSFNQLKMPKREPDENRRMRYRNFCMENFRRDRVCSQIGSVLVEVARR